MEKKYIVPTAKVINLNGESPLLVTSGGIDSNTSKEGKNALTQKQDFINTPWDDWSE